jgi:DNA-binding MarR family transcriptional regulator
MKYEQLKLDNQLCFLFYTASRAVTRMYGPLLEELGVTYPQYLTLLILWEHGDSDVSRITELLQMDTGTVSPMLKRLEVNGIISRQRSKDDERRVIISLTRMGSDLKKKAASVPGDLLCRTGLSHDEYSAAKETLNRLLKKINSVPECLHEPSKKHRPENR